MSARTDARSPGTAALFSMMLWIGAGGFGVFPIWLQHHRITTYLPTNATVISTRVETESSRSARPGDSLQSHPMASYVPVVEYRYQVGVVSYTSDSVFPIRAAINSRRWAKQIVNQFNEGETIKAFYNPEDPTEAFLLKPYRFIHHAIVLGAVAGTCLIWWGIGIRWRQGQNRQASLVLAGFWYSVGLAVCGQYFCSVQPPYQTLPLAGTAVYMTLGLLPVAGTLPHQGIWGKLRSLIFGSVSFIMIGLVAGALIGLLVGVLVGAAAKVIFGKSLGGYLWGAYGALGGVVVGLALAVASAVYDGIGPASRGKENVGDETKDENRRLLE